MLLLIPVNLSNWRNDALLPFNSINTDLFILINLQESWLLFPTLFLVISHRHNKGNDDGDFNSQPNIKRYIR